MMRYSKIAVVGFGVYLACVSLADESAHSSDTDTIQLKSESQTSDGTSEARPSDAKTTALAFDKLTNEQLVVELNDINQMSSSEQRELLIEIQRRILKDGPEPFVKGRQQIAESSEESPSTVPKLEEETVKLVTTEIRRASTKEYTLDPEKANVRDRESKKPPPYGSAYNQ